jgi:hypothetical protein
MPLTIVAQNLVTVSLDQASPAREVIQPEAEWIDLAPYQDIGALSYFSEQGYQSPTNAAGTFYVETSPVKEDAPFRQFVLDSINANTTPVYWGSGATIAHLSTGTTPFFRWLRWRILGPTAQGTATWTFRVVLVVNPAAR